MTQAGNEADSTPARPPPPEPSRGLITQLQSQPKYIGKMGRGSRGSLGCDRLVTPAAGEGLGPTTFSSFPVKGAPWLRYVGITATGREGFQV